MRRLILIGWIVVCIVIASGVVAGVAKGWAGRPNWGSLHRESTYVWEHHATADGTAMFGYLPAAVFFLWPFMVWTRTSVGLVLYVLANAAAGVGAIWIVYRWWGGRERAGPLFVVVALLICANVQHVLQANQLTLWALFLSVAGLALVGHRWSFTGGAVLGAAGLIKTMPLLLGGYLLMRRKWWALSGMAAAFVVFDLVPSIAFFGWHGMIDEHRKWLQRSQWHGHRVQLEDPMVIGVYRHTSNFSYVSVLTRWLRGLPDGDRMVALAGDVPPEVEAEYQANLQPGDVFVRVAMPPPGEPWAEKIEPIDEVPRFSLARWSAQTVGVILVVTAGIPLAILCVATWRSARYEAHDWPAATAVWILAIFFVSPMMRHYYLALALPAVAVVWQSMLMRAARSRGRWTPGMRLGAAALIGWLIGVFTLGWDLGRWYGIHLAVCLLLLIATVQAWRFRLVEAKEAAANRTTNSLDQSVRV